MSFVLMLPALLLVSGCSSATPKSSKSMDVEFLKRNGSAISTRSTKTSNIENACSILRENPDWFRAAVRTDLVYGVPIHTQLAFVRHESQFVKDARPLNKNKKTMAHKKYASTAYGFSQALNGTWEQFKSEMKDNRLDRTNFGHSLEFIGWYNSKNIKSGLVRANNVSHLYLAYHEGPSGYKNKSYRKKPWLINYSKAVSETSEKYRKQLSACNLTMKTLL